MATQATQKAGLQRVESEIAFDSLMDCLKEAGDWFCDTIQHLAISTLNIGCTLSWFIAILYTIQKNPQDATISLSLVIAAKFGEVSAGYRELSQIPSLPFIAIAIIWAIEEFLH